MICQAKIADNAYLGADQYRQLITDGHVRLGPYLGQRQLDDVRLAFGEAWAAGREPQQARCRLLAWEPFRAVLRSPRLLGLLDVIFEGQAQLLDYHLLYQPPADASRRDQREQPQAARDWHRDFTFVRDEIGRPLMIVVLTAVDDIDEAAGPTLVLPGTHRVPRPVVACHDPEPHPDELALPLRAGETIVMNGAVVHSRGLNRSERPRRAIVQNFGYWWMKPWDGDVPLPDGLPADSPAFFRQLIGVQSPCDEIYMFADM